MQTRRYAMPMTAVRTGDLIHYDSRLRPVVQVQRDGHGDVIVHLAAPGRPQLYGPGSAVMPVHRPLVVEDQDGPQLVHRSGR